MKRKSDLKLDKKDRELLYLLDVNGRTPYSQIAKKTRMSKQLVKYRMDRLEKEGFIKGYYALIDNSRLGLTNFRVYLKFRNADPSKRKQIKEYLKKQKDIWAVATIAGKWDLGIGLGVKNIYQFYEIWENFLKKYLTNINDYRISVYSPIYHYSSSYLVEKEDTSKVRILGGKEKASFDDKDIKILIELSKNGRISLVELSGKINMSPENINYRIKQLEIKGIIQGYRAIIDVSKLGYEFYKVEIRLLKYENIDSLFSFCHRHPNISQIDKVIGGETFEMEVHVKSIEKLFEIIGEIENKFPKLIDSVDYITILSFEKITYMPEMK